jgi:hypothetical protein
MSVLRFSSSIPLSSTSGQLRETCQLLRVSLRGKRLVSVTEERYLENEKKLFARMAERLGAESDALSYSQFVNGPKSVEADILLLRTSKLFVVSFQEILGALESFRRENSHSAIIVSVLDAHAFDALSSRPDLVNMIDSGAVANDPELLRKGAEILERIS